MNTNAEAAADAVCLALVAVRCSKTKRNFHMIRTVTADALV
jgi:hypothetical protein